MKTLLTIDKLGSKIAINSVFDCHLSPVRRKTLFLKFLLSMFVNNIIVFDCRLSGVLPLPASAYECMCTKYWLTAKS